jgi:type 1 glutamine amidotransferase
MRLQGLLKQPLPVAMALILLLTSASRSETRSQGPKNSAIRVLIVTGGHDFERAPFFKMWTDLGDIDYREAVQPGALSLFGPELKKRFDAIVFYDMVETISEEQKAAFVNLLKQGVGILFLHHSLASYQNWDEYEKILGGKYYLAAGTKDGQSHEASTFQHDVEVPVHVVDPNHPVTRGVSDFILRDEVYGKYEMLLDMRPLLETSHPLSSKTIAWWHPYGKSRIVFIQLGHDHWAYENPAFRKLVKQALVWLIGKRD